MNNGTAAREEPIVGCILQHEDVIGGVTFISKTAPPFAHQCPHTSLLDSFEDHLRESVWVVNDDTAEADIYRWLASIQEIGEFLGWLEGRGKIQENKACDINLRAPIWWLGNKRWRPEVCVWHSKPE